MPRKCCAPTKSRNWPTQRVLESQQTESEGREMESGTRNRKTGRSFNDRARRRVMRVIMPAAVAAAGATLGAVSVAHAASGTWTTAGSGLWSDTSKWSGGTVANGSGSIADFSTLNLAADATV